MHNFLCTHAHRIGQIISGLIQREQFFRSDTSFINSQLSMYLIGLLAIFI